MKRRDAPAGAPADEGVALLLVLVFVLVIAVLVGALLNQSFTTFKSAKVAADIENRVFAANGGVDWGIQQVRDGVPLAGAPACTSPAQGTQSLTGTPLAINGRTVTVTCEVTSAVDPTAGDWAAFVTQPAGGIATWHAGVDEKAISGAVYNAGSFAFNDGSALRVHNGNVVQVSAAACVPPAGLAVHPDPPYRFACAAATVATPAPAVHLDRLPNYINAGSQENPVGEVRGARCRSFAPGHYVDTPQFLTTAQGINHLRSGVYDFDNVGVIDIADATVLGGTPPPGEEATTGWVTEADNAGCAVQTEAETKGNYGVVLVLGGNSTLRIRGQSRVELYSYRDPDVTGDAGLSILQLPASIDPPKQSTVVGPDQVIVQTAPGASAKLAVHGEVYTPRARVSLFGTSQAWATLQAGVVAAGLDLQAAPGPSNFEVSTPIGAGSRTIRLVATTNSVGGEKQIRAVADVVVVNDASRTVSVTSWRVEQ